MDYRIAALISITVAPTVAGQCTPQWLPDPMSVPGVQGVQSSDAVMALVSWDPDGPGNAPAKIVAAGDWSVIGGLPFPRIAAWDGATWSSLGIELRDSYSVDALAVLPTGELIAGGTLQGMPAPDVARWAGSAWVPLGAWSGTGHATKSLAVTPSGEVIAGVGAGVLRCSGSAWSLLGPESISSLAVAVLHDGTLVAAGNGVRLWNGTAWDVILNGAVSALTVLPNGDLIAAGGFGEGPANVGFARWNGQAWSETTTGLSSGGTETPHIYAVAAIANGDIVVGGRFTVAEGAAGNNIARWDGSQWLGMGLGTSGAVNALLPLPNGDLLVGGGFSFAGGQPANRLARWGTPASPTIDAQPAPQVVACGGIATFSVGVGGQGGPAYRWRRGGTDLADGPTGNGSIIVGSATPTLAVVNARTPDSGGYDCVVTTGCGVGSSSAAPLTVNGCCEADFNGNGSVSVQDLFGFLAAYFEGCG